MLHHELGVDEAADEKDVERQGERQRHLHEPAFLAGQARRALDGHSHVLVSSLKSEKRPEGGSNSSWLSAISCRSPSRLLYASLPRAKPTRPVISRLAAMLPHAAATF